MNSKNAHHSAYQVILIQDSKKGLNISQDHHQFRLDIIKVFDIGDQKCINFWYHYFNLSIQDYEVSTCLHVIQNVMVLNSYVQNPTYKGNRLIIKFVKKY